MIAQHTHHHAKKSKNVKTVFFPVRFDRVGNPISTVYKEIATRIPPTVNVMGFANKPADFTFGKLFWSSENVYLDALIINAVGIWNISKFDVLQTAPNPALLPLVWAAHLKKKQIVHTFHETPQHTASRSWLTQKIYNTFARLATHRVSISNFTARSVQEHLSLSSDVIWHGVNTNIFSVQKADRHSLLSSVNFADETRKLVLFVGALVPGKGAATVVSVAKDLPHVNFLIIGAPQHKAEAKIVKDACTATGNVRHLPFVPPRMLACYYSIADAFLFPSTIDAFGLVLVEAMACGLPVVAYDACSSTEIVSPVAGKLVSTKTPSALSIAVNYILTHEAQYTRSHIAHYAKESFPWKNAAMKYLHIYLGDDGIDGDGDSHE